MRHLLIALLASTCLLVRNSSAQTAIPVLPLTSSNQTVLVPATLGVIVNGNDPQSIELGQRYAAIRGVPSTNIIELSLPRVKYIARSLMIRELERLHTSENYSRLVAFILAFDEPYRVDANQSITSAISQGIETMTWTGSCNVTPSNPDANAGPGAALRVKPAMLLFGGGGEDNALALAERGRSADMTDPMGEVYYVKTSDVARSRPREPAIDRASSQLSSEIGISTLNAQTLANRSDVMGYETGLASLNDLETLHFLPGAFADHLTSYGGAINDDKHQTTVASLMKAGATASYGTVREPCNYPGKFPDPARLLANYLHGDTILEAYWKSIGMLTEGLLVGEPLSRPFPVADAEIVGTKITVKANRHTQAVIAQTGKKEVTGAKEHNIEMALFEVESGTPKLLDSFTIAGSLGAGDLLVTYDIGVGANKDLILGLLPLQ